jgi:DNA-binding response OmpR family regulator
LKSIVLNERILIAEDDDALASKVFAVLERNGYSVEAVYSGQAALHRCSTERFDLVLLDAGLPGLGGLAFLQRLRSELRVHTPVLVISARSDLSDKLAAFEHGADDYMTKPFALAEVEARVRALLNRSRGTAFVDPVRRCGPLVFDIAEHEARVGETSVRLTPKAAQLLELLLRRPGQLVRRAGIEQAIWGDSAPNADAVRSQVHWLRKALADAGFDGIETVHGVGYRIVDRSSGR